MLKLKDSDDFASALTAFFRAAATDALDPFLIGDANAIQTLAGYADETETEALDKAITTIRDADDDDNGDTNLCSIITSVAAGETLLRQAEAHSALLVKSHVKLSEWRSLVQQAVKLIHDFELVDDQDEAQLKMTKNQIDTINRLVDMKSTIMKLAEKSPPGIAIKTFEGPPFRSLQDFLSDEVDLVVTSFLILLDVIKTDDKVTFTSLGHYLGRSPWKLLPDWCSALLASDFIAAQNTQKMPVLLGFRSMIPFLGYVVASDIDDPSYFVDAFKPPDNDFCDKLCEGFSEDEKDAENIKQAYTEFMNGKPAKMKEIYDAITSEKSAKVFEDIRKTYEEVFVGLQVFRIEGDGDAVVLCRDTLPLPTTVQDCKKAADSAMGFARDTLRDDVAFTQLGCISLCCRLLLATMSCGVFLESYECDLYNIRLGEEDIGAWQQFRKALNQLKNSECVLQGEEKGLLQLAVQDAREQLVGDADCFKSFTEKRWTSQVLTCVTDLRGALPSCVVSEEEPWSTRRNTLLSSAEMQKEFLTNPRFSEISPMLDTLSGILDVLAAIENDKEGGAVEAYILYVTICIIMYIHTHIRSQK